jgi:transcriptional regulator GlxA family with amidase domain
MLPSGTIYEQSRAYYWEGSALLSIKTFTGGRGYYRAGPGHFVVDETNYLILNHGQEYSISIESERPVHSFCVFFAAGLVEDVRRSLEYSTERLLDDPYAKDAHQSHFVERTYPRTAVVIALLDRLLRAGEDHGRRDEAYRELMTVLFQVQGQTHDEVNSLSATRHETRDELYRRLHLARDYAETFLDDPVSLEDMARVASLSPNHLLRTFREVFGQTPHQYIVSRRVERARTLLANTDLPIGEVCVAVGFHSPGSFSWLFRRHVGLSPQEYRRSFR